MAKEKDHEVSMAKTQVKKSIDNLQKVARVLAKKSDADNLPAWVQAKITDTAHDTDATASYMTGGDDVSEVYDSRNPKDRGNPDNTLRRAVEKMGGDPKKVLPSKLPLANSHEPEGEFLEEKKKKGGTLHNWFGKSKSKDGKKGWVQSDGSPCANEEGETKTPKCYSSRRLAGLKKTKEGRNKIRSADARKSRKDPGQQQKSGGAAPTMVRTFTDKKDYKKHKSGDYSAEGFEMQEARDIKGKGSGKKDACYKKVKARYDVWPSAYASGALVKCRKVGAANWGNKTKKEEYELSNWREESLQEGLPLAGLARLVLPGLARGLGQGAMRSLPYILAPEAMKTITVAQAAIPAIGAVAGVSRKIAADQEAKNLEKKRQLAAQGIYVEQYKEGDEIKYSKDTQKLIDRANETPIQNLTRRARQTGNSIQLKAPRNPLTLPEAKNDPCWVGYKQVGMKKKGGKMVPNCVKEGYSNWREELAEDWQKVNKGDKTDGMSQKAVDAYRRENPGSKLKTAVTEKNPKGKRAKRRKSFCARSDGQRKMHNIDCSKTPDKAICKARRRWRC